jgi:hypothetical protein
LVQRSGTGHDTVLDGGLIWLLPLNVIAGSIVIGVIGRELADRIIDLIR